VHGAAHHLAPKFLTLDRTRRRGQHGIEEAAEHLGASAPRRGVEDVGDAVLPLAEDEQGLRREQLPHEPLVPGRGGRVEEPSAVSRPEEAVGVGVGVGVASAAAGKVVVVLLIGRLSEVEQEAACDGGTVGGGVAEARVVVPDGLEAADAAEGGELDEEVWVEAEELPDDVVVAAGRRPVDGRGVPPLVARALPPQRQERVPRFLRRRHLHLLHGLQQLFLTTNWEVLRTVEKNHGNTSKNQAADGRRRIRPEPTVVQAFFSGRPRQAEEHHEMEMRRRLK